MSTVIMKSSDCSYCSSSIPLLNTTINHTHLLMEKVGEHLDFNYWWNLTFLSFLCSKTCVVNSLWFLLETNHCPASSHTSGCSAAATLTLSCKTLMNFMIISCPGPETVRLQITMMLPPQNFTVLMMLQCRYVLSYR